ncbi:MAG: protein-export chaperone SecB [Steroidobacteraceae bacterium]|jgi:preprotein translocase subunit SecB|nr:protein-export chaperone SecB [Steroidobacteraceae bacterium]
MADETPQAAPAAAGNGAQQEVTLQSVYIKDLSFEAPKGPFVPAQNQDPKMSINLNTSSSVLAQDVHEVVLTITLEAKNGEVPVYVAEVKQGGVFVVRGFSADDVRRILGAFAPNVLFPYVRQTVSDLVTKGGFPPFFLPPVNFDALYERSRQEQAARQQAAAAAPSTPVN